MESGEKMKTVQGGQFKGQKKGGGDESKIEELRGGERGREGTSGQVASFMSRGRRRGDKTVH